MKKGQIFEGVVEKYTFPNKGYVKVEDRMICIKGALVGQKVRFSIKRLKKGAGEGRLIEVLSKSPLEDVEPLCTHFGQCGGCAYQTVSYENQLRLKEEQVKNILANAILTVDNNVDNVDKSDNLDDLGEKLDVYPEEQSSNLKVETDVRKDALGEIWEGIKASPVTKEYRNKMEYSFGDEYKEGPLSLGMHRKGGFHDIVTVDKCTIVDDDYNKIIRATRDFYEEKQVPFYKKMQHVGILRHLVVRQSASNKEILVNLVTTTRDDLRITDANGFDITKNEGDARDKYEDRINDKMNSFRKELSKKLYLDEFVDCLLSLPLNGKIAGILHTWNNSLSDAVVPERVVTLYGKDYIYDEVLGLKFKISPFSFFQTNTRSAEVLYETARSYVMDGGSVNSDKVVFDLYSGTGTIAQILAPVAKKVVGVEIVKEAVEAAKVNAELNGLTNCEFIAGDVLKVLDTIDEKPDMIVLDPPRDGCNPKALEKIINYNVPEMVYISCKPTSLARDLEMLQERGYRVTRACAVDQFPGTLHVECIVCIQKIQRKGD